MLSTFVYTLSIFVYTISTFLYMLSTFVYIYICACQNYSFIAQPLKSQHLKFNRCRSSMSFMNIKDPDERDDTIADYLAMVKRLKRRNLQERSDLMDRQRDLEVIYEPIVTSNQKMTQDVIKVLIPIKKELNEINRNIDNLREEHPHLAEEDFRAATPQKRFKEAAAITPTLTPRQRILNIGVTAAKYFKHALNNNTNDNIFGFLFKDEDNKNINNLMIKMFIF